MYGNFGLQPCHATTTATGIGAIGFASYFLGIGVLVFAAIALFVIIAVLRRRWLTRD